MNGSGDSERRRKLLQLASAAAFLTLAVVLVAIVISAGGSGGGNAEEIVGAEDVEALLSGIPQSGMTLGDPAAKAKLVEFGDLKCPHCAEFSKDQIAEVIENQVRPGKARLEFRNFTIIDAESVPAGAAALAAGEQGRGWQYIETFYRNQGLETDAYVTDAFMKAVAKAAGVRDLARWERERQSSRIIAEVKATTEEAAGKLGFEGTPSFAVIGPRTQGLEAKGFLETAADLEAAVEAAS